MRMLRYVIAVFALCLIPSLANAAACTWTGGTGNWDNSNTASWSCGHVPVAVDTVTFDGTSGGGIVTVCGASSANCPNGAGVVTVTSITSGAFTGTLDFAANNPNVTLTTFSNTGSGARTVTLGSGTWTINTGGVWNWITLTNCTSCTTTSANIVFGNGSTNIQFFGGAHTYASLTTTASTGAIVYSIEPGNNANNTFTTCTFNAIGTLQLRAGTTQTCTNGFTIAGSSASAQFLITTDAVSNTAATLAVGSASSCSYCAFRGITGATSAITATNAFNFGGNGGTLSITGPSGGASGGFIIGG